LVPSDADVVRRRRHHKACPPVSCLKHVAHNPATRTLTPRAASLSSPRGPGLFAVSTPSPGPVSISAVSFLRFIGGFHSFSLHPAYIVFRARCCPLGCCGSLTTALSVSRRAVAQAGVDFGMSRAALNGATGRIAYRGRVMNRAARINARGSSGQVSAKVDG
jgi:hypothetical protein